MTPDEIKNRGRRITEELFNQGDLRVIDEIIAPSYTQYLAVEGCSTGSAELATFIQEIRRAFPDLHAHTEQQVVEGDTLVQRLGLLPTPNTAGI
jgi:predicted ester cyclase